MRTRRWAVLSATVLSTAVLCACSAGGEGHAGGAEAPEAGVEVQRPSSTTPAEDAAPGDAAICTAFGDVLTIVENADLGLADGRMEAHEHDGWYQLATRVLGRLPSGGDSAVQVAIGELQEVAPAVPSGAVADVTGVRSAEWSQVVGDLGGACDALGAPLAISVFTGG